MKPEYIKDLAEGLQIVMKKMFDIVGAPYDLHLVDSWYTKYEWTKEEEAQFKDFFLGFAKNHPKRRDVVNSLCRTKKNREEAFMWFNLAYGWKEVRDDS